MTVPKFRAWDIHEKKMFTNDQIIIWNNNVYANDGGKLKPDRLMGWSIDDKYLMQSTGLKDRNGIEIFEGDVVSWIDNGILHFGVVKFTKGMFLVNGVYPVSEEMEIIGNVYEHPDLVED